MSISGDGRPERAVPSQLSPVSWSLPSRLRPRPRLCSALDPEAQPQLQELSERLQAFYNDSAVAADYFAAAERVNPTWTPKMTGHWRLKQAIPPGSRVVDLGCGTAHPCRNLEDRDVRYTGVDWSKPQIDHNRGRMPNHEFVAASLYRTPLSAGSFDAAISLYTIEHLCWPHLLLEEMLRLVRPGGLIAVLTPPFRQRAAIKSFDYGLSPRPFKDKLRTLRWLDAALHLYQHRVAYPWFLRRNHPIDAPEHRFLIHLDPICLQSRTWFPDADAVYLTYAREILDHLVRLGADEVELRPFDCYVVARKR